MSDDNQHSIDDLQQQIQSLTKQNAKLTKALDTAKSTASQFDGLDVEQAKAAIQFKLDSDRKQLESQGNYEQALQAEKEKFNQAINREKAHIENLTTQLKSTLVDGAISTAISKAGGKLRPLSALIQSENLVRVVDEDGKLVARVFAKDSKQPRNFPDSSNPMSVDDLVRELATDKELAGLFPASGNSGSGAPPSQNVNTIPSNPAKSGFTGNLTEIAKTLKSKIGV